MSEYPAEVVDEQGLVHRLAPKPLGEGGQGVVFATSTPGVVVKFITSGARHQPSEGTSGAALLDRLTHGFGAGPSTNERDREMLRQRIEGVRVLPTEKLHVARPLALLRGHVGYSMQFLTGMEPIRCLIAPAGVPSLATFYRDTGGLRRRLRLLASAAQLLGRLHALPLVYGDVSPNNVFISSSHDASETWLIDTDNLHFQTDLGPAVYTPGFGAPELVRGHASANTLTDAHAFAVLAFWVLAQVHPFLGDLVESGGWDADEDLEEKAFRGELPWVLDEDDDQNHTENGVMPRELVLTPRLRALFQHAFGSGRLAPTRRPSLLEWAEALHQAADVTVKCGECGSTFYVMAFRCPWCGTDKPAQYLYMEVRRWDGELDDDLFCRSLHTPPIWYKVLDADGPGVVHRHVLMPSVFRDDNPVALQVEFARQGVKLIPQTDDVFTLVVPDMNYCEVLDSPKTLLLPTPGRGWHLHCAWPLDRPHRVVSFSYVQ